MGVNEPDDPTTTYRWVQVEGPPVDLEDASRPWIHLTIPPDARRLGFLLTIRDGHGERTARVTIPIKPDADRAEATTPRADAGDEQVGLVGRRITLNGSRSTPRDQITYRWIQIGGPKVDEPIQDQEYYSFVPTVPGIYRFILVVAADNVISEPDEVVVIVGDPPTRSPALGGLMPFSVFDRNPLGLSDHLLLETVADTFEAIAERAPLYATFADLTSEMMRRLDAVIPAEAHHRQWWSQGVFAPLTQHLTTEMLAVGLDLRMPQGHHQTLTPSQKDRLQRLFRSYAQEFRSRTQAR